MAVALPDDLSATLQKGLSEWWSEETEYVFQRIERWAAFARGYNRLRSQRLSRGRLTMQEEQDSGWRITSNKLVIDDTSWSPRFQNLKKSRRRSRPDESLRINCCARFNYQSSSNLDSSCLETYRYDHSIYFKTIGDLRTSKRNEEDSGSISSEELVEWDAEAATEFITSHFDIQLPSSNSQNDQLNNSSWPIVDFSHLQIEEFIDQAVEANETLRNASNREKCFEMMRQESQLELESNVNNNCLELEDVDLTRLNNNLEKSRDSSKSRGFGKRRSSKVANDNSLMIENGVEWTDILLSPADNVDPPTYSL